MYGVYDPANVAILAAGSVRDAEWPCGTRLEVCGRGGCIVAIRMDRCGGCGAAIVDLSEAGVLRVCGIIATCDATIRRVE